MRLKFHKKSGSNEFYGISDFQSSYILPGMDRPQSQLSVELKIWKIRPVSLVRFSKLKVLQKAGTEVYTFIIQFKSFENLEFRKNPEKSHVWFIN